MLSLAHSLQTGNRAHIYEKDGSKAALHKIPPSAQTSAGQRMEWNHSLTTLTLVA